MAISGFLFISWRLFEIIMLIPPVGMLGWFIHGFVQSNQLTPTFVLLLFIVVTLALAWAFFTTVSYLRARHDALFVALVDLGFVGALIAGVVVLREITQTSCMNQDFARSSLWQELGPFGLTGYQTGNPYAQNINKNCSMLKASFAFAILNILAFCLTFLLALLVHHHHKDDDKVVVKREYRTTRQSSRHRSSSRGDNRRSRDYGYDRPRSSHRGGSTHRSSSRRQYYV
jgi:sugar phosphate permease